MAFSGLLFILSLMAPAINPAFAEEKVANWLQVPEGFKVTQFADDSLATNIYCMTTDRRGRIVVAGPGYIKILLDKDGDGLAESTKLFSSLPKNGAMGLCFDGTDLLCVGDQGLLRFRDRDRDDQADGPPEVLIRFKTGGEHDSHAIRRGPDGWWYLISGNYSGVGSTMIRSSRSPIKNPTAGVITRISPDFQQREIVADGMRNAYDFDFDEQGHLYTYDSDGERDVSLPWYRPTRVFRLHPGSHAGWISRSWKRPGFFFDMPTVAASLGRGSPTGVVCYRHWQFPKPYQNATFVLDWTFGRVIAVRKTEKPGPSGSGDVGDDANSKQKVVQSQIVFENELLVSAKGTHGFAPTDACVGIDGSLYVCVGGRSTQGSVYRIRHVESAKTVPRIEPPASMVDCLDLPQPQSAWSQALAKTFVQSAGQEKLEEAILNESLSIRHRSRAIELVTSYFNGVSAKVLSKLSEINQPEVQARLAWSVCRKPVSNIESAILFHFLNHSNDTVRIAAIEALVGNQNIPSYLAEPVMKCLESDNLQLQKVTAEFIRSSWFDPVEYLSGDKQRTKEDIPLAYWLGRQLRKTEINIEALDAALLALEKSAADKKSDPIRLLQALRLYQIALGDVGPVQGLPEVFESYRAKNTLPQNWRSRAETLLHSTIEDGNERVREEAIRCIAMSKLATDWTANQMLSLIKLDSNPQLDIHILAAIAHSEIAHPSQREKIAGAILGIQPKIDQLGLNQDRNWEPRFKEVVRKLIQLDGDLAGELANKGINSPGQLFLFQFIDQDRRVEAIDRYIATLREKDEFEVDSDLARLLASTSHSPHWELIRKSVDSANVRDTIVELLARKPYEGDRSKFVLGLESPQVKTARIAAQSLLKLQASKEPVEQLVLLDAMKRISPDKEGYSAREWIVKVLQRNLGKSFGFVFGTAGHHPQTQVIANWSRFLEKEYPEEFKKRAAKNFDASQLAKKLFDVDWQSGDFEKGKELYTTLSCAKCHGNRNRLGPDLSGVTKRFSRDDLFRAIVDPDYQVPSRYQTTLFETSDGRYHSGIIIYDSVDGVLIRDSDNKTVRIEKSDIVQRKLISRSLMPKELLKDLDGQGFADLFAYLKSL